MPAPSARSSASSERRPPDTPAGLVARAQAFIGLSTKEKEADESSAHSIERRRSQWLAIE
jgi:hypothetical protein